MYFGLASSISSTLISPTLLPEPTAVSTSFCALAIAACSLRLASLFWYTLWWYYRTVDQQFGYSLCGRFCFSVQAYPEHLIFNTC